MLLGDLIEQALHSVGVTPDRVSNLLGHTLKGCTGCESRKRILNSLSQWASRVLQGKTNDALRYLSTILDGLEQ